MKSHVKFIHITADAYLLMPIIASITICSKLQRWNVNNNNPLFGEYQTASHFWFEIFIELFIYYYSSEYVQCACIYLWIARWRFKKRNPINKKDHQNQHRCAICLESSSELKMNWKLFYLEFECGFQFGLLICIYLVH